MIVGHMLNIIELGPAIHYGNSFGRKEFLVKEDIDLRKLKIIMKKTGLLEIIAKRIDGGMKDWDADIRKEDEFLDSEDLALWFKNSA